MMTFNHLIALLTLTFSITFSFAQNGQYDVRFNMHDYDCDALQLFVDVEVKAADAAKTFKVSDQNYRFSFNRDAVMAISPEITGAAPNPADRGVFISEELTLTSFVADPLFNFSFFDAHTLTGSRDTVVSYNVRLAGGDGYFLDHTTWVKVGRLRLQLTNANACVELRWHDHDPVNFPPTFIGEKSAAGLSEAAEGNYTNLITCVADLCAGPLPVELTSFNVIEDDCSAYLEWSTATEENNDYFAVQRSFDGRSFETIAIVAGNGTTQTAQYYSYVDTDIEAENYYRLVQVDFDGTSTTTDIQFVKSDCFDTNPELGETVVFPNPVSQGTPINVRYFNEGLSKDATIIITDVAGRILYNQAVNLDAGYSETMINIDRLAPGAYFLRVQGDNWFGSAEKFIKLSN